MNTPGFKSLGANEEELDANESNASLQSTLTETTNEPNSLITSFAVGGKRETLRYPRQSLEAYGYDYIQITAFDYEPSGLETGKIKTGFKGSNRRFQEDMKLFNYLCNHNYQNQQQLIGVVIH